MAELSTLLKAMRRTAEIAGANAADALGAGLSGAGLSGAGLPGAGLPGAGLSGGGLPGGSVRNFVADDLAVTRSLLHRLDDDLAYLTASLEGARQVLEIAAGDQALLSPPPPPAASRGVCPAELAGAAPGPVAGCRAATAVVLCALNVEYLAMRAQLTGLRRREHPAGTRFEVGELAGTGWQVALAITGSGNIGAAVMTERAIALFSPAVVLCVGVAGSLKENVKLGDVVVATRVDAYDGGTAAEHFLARPKTWPAPHRLDQLARELVRPPTWWERLPGPPPGDPPTVHFRPIAAGEVVLDSRDAELYARLRLHNNDAAAIEMEGAGIAQAAHFNDAPALVIRGISDLADGAKAAADREGWQQRASANAAAFAVCLLEILTPPDRRSAY